MRLFFLLLYSVFYFSCISFGPDYREAKKICVDHGGFKEGNPVYFSCLDKSKWKRCSHGEYDFLGMEEKE
jgi:hypothetical protein